MYRPQKLIWILCLMCILTMACEEGMLIPPLSEPEELYQDGMDYMQEGNFNEAIDIWEDALAMGSADTAMIYTGLGLSYAFLDSFDVSGDYLNQAVAVDPFNGAAWCGLAFVESARSHLEDALTALLRAKELLGSSKLGQDDTTLLVGDAVDLEILLAQLYFGLGRYSEAGEVLSALSEEVPDPERPETWYGYASYVQALLIAIEQVTVQRIAEREESLLAKTGT